MNGKSLMRLFCLGLATVGYGESIKGKHIIDSLQQQLEVLPKCTSKRTVLSLVSIDPVYVYGKESVLNDKLELACFTNVVDSALGAYPQLSKSYILKKDPDVIIGNTFEALDTTFFELYPELRSLKAYKTKQIFKVDDDLSSRPTHRYLTLIHQLKSLNE